MRREDVIGTAMLLLDERGLDGVTMRGLAQRLGVQVGALYWHVKDKRAVLTALAERVVADALPAELPDRVDSGSDWAEQLVVHAHRLRTAMLAHRDGARLVAGYAPESVDVLRVAEHGLRLLVAAGVPVADAAYAGDAVMSFVSGFVLQEQAEPTPSADGVDPAEFPLLVEWARTRPVGKDAAFERGLDYLVGGIRVRLFPAG